MSELTPEQNELAILRTKADSLGVDYHTNLGADKLRERIKDKEAEIAAQDAEAIVEEEAIEAAKPKVVETFDQAFLRLRLEGTKLIRVNVSPMDPSLKEYDGEYFSVTNRVVGTITKFVKFNTADGYHIPNVIYKHLLHAKCQVFVNVPDPRTGKKKKQGKLIPRFNITVLPDLTQEQLDELEADQKARNAIDG